MLPELASVSDYAGCLWLVQQLLLSQDWQLGEPQRLAEEIWHTARLSGAPARLASAVVQQQLFHHYAEILHRSLRSDQAGTAERAWVELVRWLQRQVGKLAADAWEQEELVQVALEILNRRLHQGPLNAPAALWAYALQTLRSVGTDRHRQRMALKRGAGTELALEEVLTSAADPTGEAGVEQLTDQDSPATVEEAVIASEVHYQLRAFFRQQFTTRLQALVAEMHFIDGLSPQEIGDLLGKPAHEVRLVKARVVKSLRSLPPAASQALSAIINTP